MANIAPNQHILSVSELNNTVRRLLEAEFAGIWLTGEISNFARPSSGHWYFSLKDDKAQIRGAMFRGNNQRCRIRPQDGMQVLVRARISLYEPRGDYQLIVEQMESAGDGLLMQQYEQLKQQLAAQGLFAQSHKKPLPQNISRVGVVTSHTGAAIKDIISVLNRRAPQLEVVIYPTSVQGQAATEQIVHMIQTADARQEVDVLIVGRGGGSLEDLWCFNEAAVAHAIYQCQLPVVSAVGHEIDVTIADFVADVRAATPSAAAELISPDSQAILQYLSQLKAQLQRAMEQRLNDSRNISALMEQRLLRLHPQNILNSHGQKVDELSLRLNNAIRQRLNDQQARHAQLLNRFKLAQAQINISNKQQELTHLQQRLYQQVQDKLNKSRNQLELNAKQLDIVSPLSTLSRGYSITFDGQSKVVRQPEQVKQGDIIHTRLAEGVIKSQVV